MFERLWNLRRRLCFKKHIVLEENLMSSRNDLFLKQQFSEAVRFFERKFWLTSGNVLRKVHVFLNLLSKGGKTGISRKIWFLRKFVTYGQEMIFFLKSVLTVITNRSVISWKFWSFLKNNITCRSAIFLKKNSILEEIIFLSKKKFLQDTKLSWNGRSSMSVVYLSY